MSNTVLIEGRPSKQHWLYSTYQNIHTRCTNTKTWQYNYYGGRGIKNNFNSFLDFYTYVSSLDKYKDATLKNLTIDRIDNNGNYEVGNLKWSSLYEQSANIRLGVHNKSGYKGVYFNKKEGLWRAQINRNGIRIFLKCSKNKDVCIEARLRAEKEIAVF